MASATPPFAGGRRHERWRGRHGIHSAPGQIGGRAVARRLAARRRRPVRRHATVHERDEGPAELRELAADYAISGELGRGSSAVVYLARDRALDRQVAIKLVRAARADDELLERSAQEARLLASLPHNPNIVAIYAVRRLARRSLALVMQYVAGSTLREVLARDGALPTDQAVRVLRDLARALHFAHDHGIVHRDVKPENVYLEAATGRALLSDFGSAVSLHADPKMTTTGSVIGTPAYMSPEQLDGERVDVRSDVYSLGLLGWEMLTGRFPWGTANLYEILYRQRHTDLPLLDTLRPDLPTPVVNAVEGALFRDRERRWPDAATMLAALLAPPDVARIPPRVVRTSAPDQLPTEAVHAMHAQTLQFSPGLGAMEVAADGGAPIRHGAAGAGVDVDGVGADGVDADAVDADAMAAGRAAGTAGVSEPTELDEIEAGNQGAVPVDTLEWRSARVGGPYAWTPPSLRRGRPRRPLAIAGGLLLLLAAAAGVVIALGGDRELRELFLRMGGERVAGGDVSLEQSLASDLAAAATGASGDSVSGAATPPAAAPAPPGAGIDARCAAPGLANQRACLLARLTDYDAPLNETYGNLIRELRRAAGTAVGAPDPPAVRQLRAEQRQWLVERDDTCAEHGRGREGDLWAETRARCLGSLGQERTAELAARLAALRSR